MNRRHFITGSGAVLATTAATAAGEPPKPSLDWDKITNVRHHTAVCEQAVDGTFPDIKLEVILRAPAPEQASDRSRLQSFKLTWNGKTIPIPERFWKDLDGLLIQQYPKAEVEKIESMVGMDGGTQWELKRRLKELQQPRLTLSCEEGTVMIEWERSEECDSRSSIRWIISKSGTVLRHRHQQYHEC